VVGGQSAVAEGASSGGGRRSALAMVCRNGIAILGKKVECDQSYDFVPGADP
jgi:hypothetical protein